MIAIKKKDDGSFGIFATCDLGNNTIVYKPRRTARFEQRTQHTVEFNDGHYVDDYLKYINHSCKPSCKVNRKKGAIVAAGPIKEGEEITFNYLLNESHIASPFSCSCGSDVCKGAIGSVVNF